LLDVFSNPIITVCNQYHLLSLLPQTLIGVLHIGDSLVSKPFNSLDLLVSLFQYVYRFFGTSFHTSLAGIDGAVARCRKI
jgi:hypothetical protein